jgi:ribosomal protein L28
MYAVREILRQNRPTTRLKVSANTLKGVYPPKRTASAAKRKDAAYHTRRSSP